MNAYLSARSLWTQLKRWFLPWLAVAAAAGLAVLLLNLASTEDRGTLVARINFSYDGIEAGLDPSGSRFNPNEVKNEQVLSQAAEAMGRSLTPEELETLGDAIIIAGEIPQSAYNRILNYQSIFSDEKVSTSAAVRNSSYFPSQYTVTFHYTRFGCSAAEGEQWLQAVLDAYEAYFYDLYGFNSSMVEAIQSMDYSAYDYADAVEVLDTSLLVLRDYLQRLDNQDYTRFLSQRTGYTFSDLVAAINTLRSEDVSWINSYIYSNNVTRDRQAMVDYYQYRIEDAAREQTVRENRLETLNTLIANYVKTNAVILGVTNPGGDTSESSYEFSQPSETYDNLINEKIACQTSITETQERINLYETWLERLNSARETGSAAIVEERLKTLDGKLQTLLADTTQTADEYFETVRLQRAFQVLFLRSGFSPRRLLKTAVKRALPAEVLFAGLYVLVSVGTALLPEEAGRSLKSRMKTAWAGIRAPGRRLVLKSGPAHSAKR